MDSAPIHGYTVHYKPEFGDWETVTVIQIFDIYFMDKTVVVVFHSLIDNENRLFYLEVDYYYYFLFRFLLMLKNIPLKIYSVVHVIKSMLLDIIG